MKNSRIGIMVGALLCILAWAVAGWAWMSHWEWMRTGAYARNSFPMNQFARDATVAAAALTAATLAFSLWMSRYRARQSSESGSSGSGI
jgi:polyferredoxin